MIVRMLNWGKEHWKNIDLSSDVIVMMSSDMMHERHVSDRSHDQSTYASSYYVMYNLRNILIYF